MSYLRLTTTERSTFLVPILGHRMITPKHFTLINKLTKNPTITVQYSTFAVLFCCFSDAAERPRKAEVPALGAVLL